MHEANNGNDFKHGRRVEECAPEGLASCHPICRMERRMSKATQAVAGNVRRGGGGPGQQLAKKRWRFIVLRGSLAHA